MQFLAAPLGWILWFIYKYVSNYFVAIFLFTLLTRLITFPFSLKSQKAQARKAKLQPKLSRLQKKYGSDQKKLQAMQMKLHENEGVSQTEGCATSIVPLILLFGIIAVIYSPLTYISRVPSEVITACEEAIVFKGKENEDKGIKFTANELKSYKELKILQAVDEEQNVIDMEAAIAKLGDEDSSKLKGKTPAQYVESIKKMRGDFTFFGKSLLEKPLGEKMFPPTFSVLLLIPLFSYLTSVLSSLISQKMVGNQGQQGQPGQPGQGCMKFGMIGLMPIVSLVMTVTVPGAVGIYWISSNIVAVLQTVVLNKIYDLNKVRAQAEIDFLEERRQHREDKKKLAEQRKREQRKLAIERQNNPKTKKTTKSAKANDVVDELVVVEDIGDEVEVYDGEVVGEVVNDDDDFNDIVD